MYLLALSKKLTFSPFDLPNGNSFDYPDRPVTRGLLFTYGQVPLTGNIQYLQNLAFLIL